MLAKHFFGSAKVWNLSRVPTRLIDEARVILQGRYEAKMKMRDELLKAGATSVEIILPEF